MIRAEGIARLMYYLVLAAVGVVLGDLLRTRLFLDAALLVLSLVGFAIAHYEDAIPWRRNQSHNETRSEA